MASITKQPNGKYKVRYRTLDGKERAQRFNRATEARTFANAVEADKAHGTYVDPRAGRIAFQDFAEQWLADQTFDESTREVVVSRLRVHILPTFGRVELRTIRPSAVQAWLRGRQQNCAPRSVQVMLANLSAILRAAVEDGKIARNPCSSSAVRAPTIEQRRILPWPIERVESVISAHPKRYRAIPVVAAGAGLRQGEAFGLCVQDVDFLGRKLHVRQQVKMLHGRTTLAPPKNGKEREVPLAEVVAIALSERLRAYPPDVDGLIFKTRENRPMNRTYYNTHIWKPALRTTGVEPTRANGMHALRHYYASVLLDAGESIRALADYLGHSDPGFTLRVYTHLMPASEDRARRAVDAALGSSQNERKAQ